MSLRLARAQQRQQQQQQQQEQQQQQQRCIVAFSTSSSSAGGSGSRVHGGQQAQQARGGCSSALSCVRVARVLRMARAAPEGVGRSPGACHLAPPACSTTFEEMGFTVYGGQNAPYVWVGFPGEQASKQPAGTGGMVGVLRAHGSQAFLKWGGARAACVRVGTGLPA